MRKLLIIPIILFTFFSCENENSKNKFRFISIRQRNIELEKEAPVLIDTIIEQIKIVKSVKEVNETSTSYSYKMDWLNGKIRHQPNVNSSINYYIIFTDGSIQKTTKEKGMFYEKGDTIKSYIHHYK